jgi:cysteine desulfurase/selenocysteine lyase
MTGTTTRTPTTPIAPKSDFPLLERRVHDRRLVYLDSAASSQRPQCVLDAMDNYYTRSHANVHRGVYAIAEEADAHYDSARIKVGRFIGAPRPETEVIFAKNATEGINIVANSWGANNLKAGDVVLLTEMEHHANLVPWLMLAEQKGIELRWLDITDDYRLDLSNLERQLDGVKLVACTVMSNVLGTIPPFAQIAEAAHAVGAIVVAHPYRCHRTRVRLHRVQRAQDARADRDRGTMGSRRAARSDASLPRWRRHDSRCSQGRFHTE